MASKRERREKAMEKRQDALDKGNTKAAMKHAATARRIADKMREESGREKGQRTTYTGPAKQATIDKIKDVTGQTLPEATKWQKVNKAWLNDIMEKDPKLSLSQARSKLKTIFSNNRERFLTEQQRRYDANIVAPVLDTDIDLDLDLDDDSKTKVVPKITGGSEYLATDYDRPGLLDWSDLAPPEMPGTLGTAPAQAALLDRDLALYQPWRRPGVGEAFKYQPPAAPTYATRASLLGGAGPSVSDTTSTVTDTDTGTTKTDTGVTNILDWQNDVTSSAAGVPYQNALDQYYRGNINRSLTGGDSGMQYIDPNDPDALAKYYYNRSMAGDFGWTTLGRPVRTSVLPGGERVVGSDVYSNVGFDYGSGQPISIFNAPGFVNTMAGETALPGSGLLNLPTSGSFRTGWSPVDPSIQMK